MKLSETLLNDIVHAVANSLDKEGIPFDNDDRCDLNDALTEFLSGKDVEIVEDDIYEAEISDEHDLIRVGPPSQLLEMDLSAMKPSEATNKKPDSLNLPKM